MFKDWHKKDLKIGQPVYVISEGLLDSIEDLDPKEYIISDIKKTVLTCKRNDHEIKFKKGKGSCQNMLTVYNLFETKEDAINCLKLSIRNSELKNFIEDNLNYLSIEEKQEIVNLMNNNKEIKKRQKTGEIITL